MMTESKDRTSSNRNMTQPSKPKRKSTRGAHILLTSLSVAATVGGWSLLTQGQDLVAETPPPTPGPALTGQVKVARPARTAPLQPSSAVPDLASLPVRGLREVGDPALAPVQQNVQQVFAPSQKQHDGGGGQAVSQPAPQPQPPAPRPVRKVKASR